MTNGSGTPAPLEKPPVHVVERPWGVFKQFAHNQAVTVTLVTVQPGQRLSLQSHTGRSELWVMLDEGAAVQIGDEVFHPEIGDELWIPVGAKHRLTSLGPTVRVLDIAFGTYQHDDIFRHEDDYSRANRRD